MDVIKKIDSFAADIYFKLPNEINKDFVDICGEISKFINDNFENNVQIIQQENELLSYLLKVMETNDYIRMADALLYTAKPIIGDIEHN